MSTNVSINTTGRTSSAQAETLAASKALIARTPPQGEVASSNTTIVEGDDGEWTTVKGKAPQSSKAGLKNARQLYNQQKRAIKHLKDERRNKKKFSFGPYTLNDVKVQIPDIGEMLLGTIKVGQAPLVKSKLYQGPCWLRKFGSAKGDKDNRCSLSYEKDKFGKYKPTFGLCTFHKATQALPSDKQFQTSIKDAQATASVLLEDILERTQALSTANAMKAKDNFAEEDWEADDLYTALYSFFEAGVVLFKEFHVKEDVRQTAHINYFIDGEHYVHYKSTYPDAAGWNMRIWYIVIIAIQTYIQKKFRTKCFIPTRKVIDFLGGKPIGHPFASAILEELDNRTRWPEGKCVTLALDSWSEGKEVFVVDTVVHIDTITAINRYTGREPVRWMEVIIATESLEKEFKHRCEEKVRKLANVESYILLPSADNDKFKTKLTGELWYKTREVLAEFMLWRAVNPSVPFNVLHLLGSVLQYNRNAELVFIQSNWDSFRFPSLGGSGVGEVKGTQSSWAKILTEEKKDEPEEKVLPSKKNQPKGRQRSGKKQVIHVPKAQQTYTAPAAADKISSTVPTKPAAYLDTEYGVLALTGFESNWKHSVAGTGWCAFDTIISFLEKDYPKLFCGIGLPIKREFVALYARLSSDYKLTPDFDNDKLEEAHWMTTQHVIQVLYALGYNAEMYTVAPPPKEGEGAGRVRLSVHVVSPQYKAKNSKFAAVLFNKRHFEPIFIRGVNGQVVESERRIVPTGYLLTGGTRLVAGTGWKVSPIVRSLVAQFIAQAVANETSTFHHAAIRQMAVFTCWGMSNQGFIQCYPYTDIEDSDVRRLFTNDHYNKTISLIHLKARTENSLEALLTPADYFVQPNIEANEQKLLDNISKEDAYKIETVANLPQIKITPTIADNELWGTIIKSLVSYGAGSSDASLVKTPETKNDPETRYSTIEEFEAVIEKFNEDKEREITEIKEELSSQVASCLQQLEQYEQTIKKQYEYLQEMDGKFTETQEKHAKETIRVNNELIDAIKLIKSLETEIETNKKISVALEAQREAYKRKAGFFERLWNFILSVLGFRTTPYSGGQIDMWSYYLNKIKNYPRIDLPSRSYKETVTSTVKNTYASIMPYTSAFYSKFVGTAQKLKDGASVVLSDSDVELTCSAAVKDGKLDVNYNTSIGLSSLIPYSLSMVNGLSFGFSKHNITGFRSSREVVMEYDHANKTYTQHVSTDERFALGGRSLDIHFHQHIGAGKHQVLRQVEFKQINDRFSRIFMKKDFGTAELINSFKTNKETGGYSVKRTIFNTILSGFMHLVSENHWSNVRLNIGATSVKIPGSFNKPFLHEYSRDVLLNSTSECVLMEDYLGKVRLAEVWMEENTPQSFDAINQRCRVNALAPRLPALAKTRVAPEFKLYSHEFWVQTRLTPTLQFIRAIAAGLLKLTIVPTPLVALLSAFIPFRYGVLSTLLSASLPLIDLLKFKLEYTPVKHYHMVATGLISQLNPASPCLTASSSALLTAKRSAVQVNVSTWFNNLNVNSLDMHTANLAATVARCQGDWLNSTTAYALALFDRAASSVNTMQRSYQ